MANSHSPLRYPGGKQVLARVLAQLISVNGCEGGTYVEPYAGGAGAALTLLFEEYVERLILNDADPRIYAFWHALLRKTDDFLCLLHDTPVNVDEWENQRRIYLSPSPQSCLTVGFATFYLNRCNRSGIISNGGVIGGRAQKGRWRMDARFNRTDLETRIRRVSLYGDRVQLSNLDAVAFLGQCAKEDPPGRRLFVYLDPPYYGKGSQLYMNHYDAADHEALAGFLRDEASFVWVLTYDNVAEIRSLYRGFRRVPFDLGYSVRNRRVGSELMITKRDLPFPRAWRRGLPQEVLSAADLVGTAPGV